LLCLNLSLLLGNDLSILDWHLSIGHAIILEWTIILGTIFKCEDSGAMLEVLFPFSFVLAAVRIVEGTFAMSLS